MKKVNNYTPLSHPVRVTEQVWSDDTMPVVSVFNWVYNHKEYIRESIESIVMQQTTFPIEIIIHDDASNDGTKEIILEYQEKYPRLFKNILQQENQWSQGKSVMQPLLKAPRGTFIALSHGDDYWTDPLKLQKQFSFMEKNDEYAMCFHEVNISYQNQKVRKYTGIDSSKDMGFEDFVDSNKAATCSVFFRNGLLNNEFFDTFNQVPVGDWFLNLSLSELGKIYFLNDCMAIYRRHEGGVWSSSDEQFMPYNEIEVLSKMMPFFGKEQTSSFTFSIKKRLDYLKKNHISSVQEMNTYKSFNLAITNSISYKILYYFRKPINFFRRLMRKVS